MKRRLSRFKTLPIPTLLSIVLAGVLLLVFPFLTQSSASQPGDDARADAKGLTPSHAMLRMLLASEDRAQELIRNPGCEPAIDDETILNRLIIMGYLERIVRAEGGFSNALTSYPFRDRDRDGFSAHPWASGATFRGKDCNDREPDTRPLLGGNRQGGSVPVDIEHDYNCNGIYGRVNGNGTTYDDEFCTFFEDDKGLLVFGDSWASGLGMDASCLESPFIDCMNPGSRTVYNQPERSWATGYSNSTSVYTEMVRRNRCAHRQWANLAEPGAKMADFARQVRRHVWPPGKPNIIVVQFAMADVCTDSAQDMTDPVAFEAQLLAGLNELDTTIGNGTHVVLMGLGNGKQYNLMWNQTYPITPSIRYSDVYEYWSCVGLNPCPTYLNSDPAIRATATQRALELDATIEHVARNYRFDNFHTVYLDTDEVVNEAVVDLIRDGIDSYRFFDAFDGFHPSLDYSSYFAEAFVDIMEERFPGFLGNVNPHNAEINTLFGDQGGH